MNTYKLVHQFAHHTVNESETHEATAEQVLQAFDRFDWVSQLIQATELQRVSPTLAVEAEGQKTLWASVVGDPDRLEFITNYSFPGTIRRFFGLIKYEGLDSVETTKFTLEQARSAFLLFLNGSYDDLCRFIDEA